MAQKPITHRPIPQPSTPQPPTPQRPANQGPAAQRPAAQAAAGQAGTASAGTTHAPAARTSVGRASTVPAPAARLELQPVVHVADMAASVAFYQRLGGEVVHGRPEDDWVLLQVGAVQINLVAGDPGPSGGDSGVELNIAAPAPIDQYEQTLPGARFATHRNFGRHLLVRSPDGMLIRINEREPDLT
jgi:catechol 2,3-dioxygenase-like lactoylglutathione lyase family enzyme